MVIYYYEEKKIAFNLLAPPPTLPTVYKILDIRSTKTLLSIQDEIVIEEKGRSPNANKPI